jgi:hypothetical protein
MKYEVTIITDRAGLTALLGVDVHMTIKTLDNGEDDRPMATATPSPAIARRNKPSKVDAVILDSLGDGPKTTDDIKAALENAELSKNSVSKLSALRKSGLIRQDDDGRWMRA